MCQKKPHRGGVAAAALPAAAAALQDGVADALQPPAAPAPVPDQAAPQDDQQQQHRAYGGPGLPQRGAAAEGAVLRALRGAPVRLRSHIKGLQHQIQSYSADRSLPLLQQTGKGRAAQQTLRSAHIHMTT